jgi:parallel beta-helix repeat protein
MRGLKAQKKLILLVIVLALTLTSLFFVRIVNCQLTLQTVFIEPDGSIYPETVPIQRNGDTYTLTDNIYAAITILKSNIVLDGAGYTLKGPYNGTSTDIWVIGNGPDKDALAQYTTGVDLGNKSVNGITIKNLNIVNFSIGMYIWTENNIITGNAISQNIVGILLSGSNTTIARNYISDNMRGLFFGFNTGETPNDIIIVQNDFEKNNIQLNGCECKAYNSSEAPHNWDNGKEGNYWSDYNGTDANHDGIGDTTYTIDPKNYDSFPLMQSPTKPPVPALKIPLETLVLGVSVPAALVAAAFVVKQRKKRKSS